MPVTNTHIKIKTFHFFSILSKFRQSLVLQELSTDLHLLLHKGFLICYEMQTIRTPMLNLRKAHPR